MAHYLRNTEKNGIEIYFDGKPSDDILTRLKENHWRWFRAKSCWYNRYSAENEALAKELCEGKSRIQTAKTTTPKISPQKFVEKQPTAPAQRKPVATPHTPVPSVKTNIYKTSVLRKDSSEIERDLVAERRLGIKDISLYYYIEQDGDIVICGEIFARIPLQTSFRFVCTLYDEDDDIIETKENSSYGSGVVTSYIKPACFFDGFPFRFSFFKPKATVARIKIVPVD